MYLAYGCLTEKPVRALLTLETTTFQYTYGTKNPKRISPDNWTLDQIFLDRPGNDAGNSNGAEASRPCGIKPGTA
jgi:hypothetical protein